MPISYLNNSKRFEHFNMIQKRQIILPAAHPATVAHLREALNVSETIATLLAQRGINTFGEAKAFFRPALNALHDPFAMKDMDKAVERIELAIDNREKILVYGDYDVDGTTAVALVYAFFSHYAEKDSLDYYIPDRNKEGYGISFAGIDFAAANGFSLIIALDCGIKAGAQIKYAREKGVDFIICDHHRPGAEIPAAIAVLDPKRDDCTYPFDELSGCGIGFKLIQAFAQRNNIAFAELEQYLDFVLVSIAADIVPITGENRILAHHGLERINKNPSLGLKTILDKNVVNREVSINDVVFVIGPRINAAGRIDSGRRAVDLLIAGDSETALISGEIIQKNNTERKGLDKIITEQALSMMLEDELRLERKSTVLYHREWHKGVIGIVASRLTDTYYRPTVVLTHSNGLATGSARSVRDFDVYEAIDACSDLLEQFGGHKYAAGLSLKLENIGPFRERFEQIVAETITEEMLIPAIEIDREIMLSEIDDKLLRILKQFAPFGPGNMNPVFRTANIICGTSRTVGYTNQHLLFDVYDTANESKKLQAIAFNQGKYSSMVDSRKPIDICYTIEENNWSGRNVIQLNVKDIRGIMNYEL